MPAIERTRCPICANGRPLDVIAELDTTWVSAPPVAVLPGYACVVARRHVEEPFQLPDDQMAAFWRESMLVARALSSLLEPRKVNYEIHGNSIPHLHLHLYPRFPGDPFEGRPIATDAPAFPRTEDDLRRMADAIAAVRRDASRIA